LRATCCSTWTIASSDADRVALFLGDGSLRSFRLVIDRSFPARWPQVCGGIQERFGREAIRMMRTHAKFAIVRNEEWAITIRGSMNLNPNPRCEQFDLDDNEEIAAFFERYVAELEAAVPAGFDVDGGELYERFLHLFRRPGEMSAADEEFARLTAVFTGRD